MNISMVRKKTTMENFKVKEVEVYVAIRKSMLRR